MLDNIQPNATGLPTFVSFVHKDNPQHQCAGFVMPGEKTIVVNTAGDVMTLHEDTWEPVENYAANIFQSNQAVINAKLDQTQAEIASLQAETRLRQRDVAAHARTLASLSTGHSVPANAEINGVLQWGLVGNIVTFVTKMIVASEIETRGEDIVIGALTVSFSVDGRANITVLNRNRVVSGYNSAHTPHPHWTSDGICLGEYSTTFEEAVSEGMIVEAIEHLMIHFASYNISDGAGETARRWYLPESDREEIIQQYDCITLQELL